MGGISRFTVSVPTPLLEALDQRLVKGGESRSAAVRRLIEAALREADEQAQIERYIRGYQQAPQTEEEFGWTDEAARQNLSEVTWE